MFEWGQNNTAEFKRLYAEGYPHSVIGSRLGCSRNASIGKAHRMGLQKRTKAAVPRAKPKPRVHKRQRFREVFPSPDESKLFADGMAQMHHDLMANTGAADVKPLIQSGEGDPSVTPDCSRPGSPACTLMELSGSTCRWPLWSDAQPERLYCGAAHIQGSPYCGVHTAKAWR